MVRIAIVWLVLLGELPFSLFGTSVRAAHAGIPRVPSSSSLPPWRIALCGLPAWFFNGGIFGPVSRLHQARIGTAYGRPIYTNTVAGNHKLAVRAIAKHVWWALVLDARDHYAPMRSLCGPGLVKNLNSYCEYEMHDWENLHKRLLHTIAARVIANLRAIRKDSLKRPPSVFDLDAIRLTFQKYRAPSVVIRTPNPDITAELARDVHVLEYPSVAAIDWRIATFKRWPLSTAVDWQAGMIAMQTVAAADNILKESPSLVRGATSALHWPVLSGKKSLTRSDCRQASRCESIANDVVESQVITDIKSGMIILKTEDLKRGLLSELRSEVRVGRIGKKM